MSTEIGAVRYADPKGPLPRLVWVLCGMTEIAQFLAESTTGTPGEDDFLWHMELTAAAVVQASAENVFDDLEQARQASTSIFQHYCMRRLKRLQQEAEQISQEMFRCPTVVFRDDQIAAYQAAEENKQKAAKVAKGEP